MEPADELVARLLYGGPEAVTVVALVVRKKGCEFIALDLLARRRLPAGDVVHHLRIAVELNEEVDVLRGELPQRQSLCLQEDLHPPVSVAEDRGVVACPLPHGRCAHDRCVSHLLSVVETACREADRAEPQLTAPVRKLSEQSLERRAILARNPLGLARQPEPNGILRRPDHHLLALAERGSSDKQRD